MGRGVEFGSANKKNGGDAMTPILPRETWLERFAVHLLMLRPQLSALEAARVAVEEYDDACDYEPEVAAAMHANDATDI
jgi:hypothetical protein